jgi:hypothetical protein
MSEPDVTVPAWVRTIVLAIVIAAIPSLTLWTINLEYRVRLTEFELEDVKARNATLQQIQQDVTTIQVQMDHVRATVTRLDDRSRTASP